jgi:hypothetical protein
MFRNNLVLMPSAAVQANVFANLQNTDGIQMSNNAYSLGGNTLSYQYNDGVSIQNRTLAQWQALGFDTASFESASMGLNGWQPVAGSPLINAGLTLGPLADYSGEVFRLRNDIGAYEAYPTTYALWQAENFTPSEMTQPALVDAAASYRGDGVPNLVKYALGLYPDALASSAIPHFNMDMTTPGSPVMTVLYQRSRWAGDLSLELQFSPDLEQWDPVPPEAQQVTSTDAAVDQIRATFLPSSAVRGFLRFKANRP